MGFIPIWTDERGFCTLLFVIRWSVFVEMLVLMFSNLIQSKWLRLAEEMWETDWSRLGSIHKSKSASRLQKQSPAEEELSWESRLMGNDSLHWGSCLHNSHVLCSQIKGFLFVHLGKLYQCGYGVYLDWWISLLKASPCTCLRESAAPALGVA